MQRRGQPWEVVIQRASPLPEEFLRVTDSSESLRVAQELTESRLIRADDAAEGSDGVRCTGNGGNAIGRFSLEGDDSDSRSSSSSCCASEFEKTEAFADSGSISGENAVAGK